jgi:hypothetical protein
MTVHFPGQPANSSVDAPPKLDSGPTLTAGIAALLKNPGYLSDVILTCGNRSIPCHRVVLAARSDVFGAMFDKDFTREARDGKVVVEDVEPDVMEELVRVMYTDDLNDVREGDDQAVLYLLKAANKYQFQYLKVACEEELAKRVDVENASSILSWALACNAGHLQTVARKFLVDHVAELLETEGFADLMRDFPDALLQSSPSPPANYPGGGDDGGRGKRRKRK